MSRSRAGTESAVAIVRQAFAAMKQSGPRVLLDRYEEWFSEDFEWKSALIGSLERRTYTGRNGFADYWDEFSEVFRDVEWGDAAFEAVSPTQVLVDTRIGTRGAGSGIPVDREIAYLMEVRGERIVWGQSFFTRAEAEEFLARA